MIFINLIANVTAYIDKIKITNKLIISPNIRYNNEMIIPLYLYVTINEAILKPIIKLFNSKKIIPIIAPNKVKPSIHIKRTYIKLIEILFLNNYILFKELLFILSIKFLILSITKF